MYHNLCKTSIRQYLILCCQIKVINGYCGRLPEIWNRCNQHEFFIYLINHLEYQLLIIDLPVTLKR